MHFKFQKDWISYFFIDLMFKIDMKNEFRQNFNNTRMKKSFKYHPDKISDL